MIGRAAEGYRRHALGADLGPEPVDQATLANARLAANRYNLAAPFFLCALPGAAQKKKKAPDPPPEVRQFWEAYPEIADVEDKLDVVARVGYERVGHFVLPASSWTEPYYKPGTQEY